MARFSDLPDELVVEILVRLPVDSLIKFKCVKKSWYSLITSPNFVAKQLHYQIYNGSTNNSVLLKSKFGEGFLRYDEEENVLSLLSFDGKTERSPGEDRASVIWKIIHLPFYKNDKYIYISGHCHGIICLTSDDSRNIVLANPSIREFRKLPQSNSLPSLWSPTFHLFCVGFGYDPRSNDYKVIQFRRPRSQAGDSSIKKLELYTLSTDSWRKVNNREPLEAKILFLQNSECIYFNGACYWIACGFFDGSIFFILSFDLSDEVFRNIQLPNISSGEEPSNLSMLNISCTGDLDLMVFNESLGFFTYVVRTNTYEIWVMDGFDSNRTWKKQLTTRLGSRIARPIFLWKNDELIVKGRDRMVCCYNLITQEMKYLPLEWYVHKCSGVSYMSSLVSVRGGNKIDI